jgi:hypothetical protein
MKLSLTDVSCGNATTDNILTTPQKDHPPQIDAVTPDTKLVTITIGGNDVGYVPLLMAAALLPRPARLLPPIGALFDRRRRQQALDEVEVACVRNQVGVVAGGAARRPGRAGDNGPDPGAGGHRTAQGDIAVHRRPLALGAPVTAPGWTPAPRSALGYARLAAPDSRR